MKQTESTTIPASSAPQTPHGAELGAGDVPSAPPAPAGRMPLFVLAGLGILLAILAGFTMLSRSRASAELEADTLDNVVPSVNVIHPKRSPAQIQLELPGNITAYEDSPIYARVSGYLKHWDWDIGTRVVAGQQLAEIET